MSELILETRTLPEQLQHLATTEKVKVSANDGTIVLMPLEGNEPPRIGRRHLTTKERLKDYDGDYKPTEWDTGEPVGREVF